MAAERAMSGRRQEVGRMAVNRRFLYWGVFLLGMGGVMVAVDLYGVDAPLVAQLVQLWPLVLIAFGVGIVLRRTRFSLAGGMLAAAMPGLVLGGAFAAGPELANVCGGTEPTAFAPLSGTFDGASSVDLRLSCGDLTVDTAPGASWLVRTGNSARIPAITNAAPQSLSVTSGQRSGPFPANRGRDVWQVTLPTTTPIDLQARIDAGTARLGLGQAQLGDFGLTVDAAEAHVDLTGAALRQLSATLNAGATSLTLPADQDITGSISVNAGALKLCAPAGLGLRIDSTTTLGSARYPGLALNGSAWETADYATAVHRADLTVTVNVGSVQLNPIGGCQ